jgi:hypothetical protein
MENIQQVPINRVSSSGLVTIRPEEWWPKHPIVEFDIAPLLFQGLLLKEKDFRNSLKTINWQEYKNSILCVYCSTGAIIPMWAYMLIGSAVHEIVQTFHIGTKIDFLANYYDGYISKMNISEYQGAKVVIKGCSEKEVPASAYAALSFRLSGVVQSLMFGEACSTVPVYKRKNL